MQTSHIVAAESYIEHHQRELSAAAERHRLTATARRHGGREPSSPRWARRARAGARKR